jgi:hypothetical protein
MLDDTPAPPVGELIVGESISGDLQYAGGYADEGNTENAPRQACSRPDT